MMSESEYQHLERRANRDGALGAYVRLRAVQIEVNDRREDQGQNNRAEQPADHGNSERLQHLGTRADGECEREHAGDGREGSHGDGAQTAAAGLDERFFRRKTKEAITLIRVEEKDAIFGDDTDDHNHAHEGRDVEGCARDKKREKAAKGGEQGGRENGDGRGKSTEFEKKNDKEKSKSEYENHKKVAEGFLLFLVKATVFDADRRRQMKLVDGFLDGGNTRAEVRAFKAAGDLDEALEILAADFRLAGIGGHRGKRTERGGAPRCAGEKSVAHPAQGRAILLREAHANRVGAIVQNNGRGRGFAFENSGGIGGDFFRGEAGAGGDGGVHLISDRWATDGVFDSIQDINHVRNFFDGVGDTRRGGFKEFGVGGKELDDDWLGLAGEVADHVLKDLNEFDVGAGLGLLNLRANVGNDFFDVALAIRFELHGEIAAIGFGDGSQAELQAGAARSVFHLRPRANDFLDVLKNAIGLREGTSRRGVIVQNEASFIHRGEEVGTEKFVVDVGEDDDRHAGERHDKWATNEFLHHRRVETDDPAKESG